MKFVSVRDFRNRPGEVWRKLREDDLVLTARGEPRGILMRVGEDELEEALEALHRARAMTALSRMRKRAADAGLDRMPPEEIEREIQAAREQRRR